MTRQPSDEMEALAKYIAAGEVVARVLDDAAEATPAVRRLALERAVQNVGEAAARIGAHYPALVAAYPGLDVPKAIAMRAVLAHDYDTIISAILETTAAEDVPAAMRAARSALRELSATRDLDR